MKLKIIYPWAAKVTLLYQAFYKPWEFGGFKTKMDNTHINSKMFNPVSWIHFYNL